MSGRASELRRGAIIRQQGKNCPQNSARYGGVLTLQLALLFAFAKLPLNGGRGGAEQREACSVHCFEQERRRDCFLPSFLPFFQVKTINGALLKTLDLAASNGVVHIIDRVLYPPTAGNIVRTLEADPQQRFTTFLKALKATKLDRDISDYSSEYCTTRS